MSAAVLSLPDDLANATLCGASIAEHLAREAVTTALGCKTDEIHVACQENGLHWCEIRS